MNNNEVVEILKAANSYLSRLKLLNEELENAMLQINTTYQDTVKNITATFSTLKNSLIEVLDKREKILLTQAHKVRFPITPKIGTCLQIYKYKNYLA